MAYGNPQKGKISLCDNPCVSPLQDYWSSCCSGTTMWFSNTYIKSMLKTGIHILYAANGGYRQKRAPKEEHYMGPWLFNCLSQRTPFFFSNNNHHQVRSMKFIRCYLIDFRRLLADWWHWASIPIGPLCGCTGYTKDMSVPVWSWCFSA